MIYRGGGALVLPPLFTTYHKIQMDLLTLTAIAERLNISESTIRYYARKFAKVLPSVGEGRQKRYRPEAVEVLQIIAEMFKENRTATDIFNHLAQRFPVNIKTQAEQQQSTLAVQQQSNLINNQVVTVLLQKITAAMDTITTQHKEIVQAKDRELASVRSALDANTQELTEARTTITKARNELQRLLEIKQDAEQKAKMVIDQQEALEAREKELAEVKAEVERLKLPFWRRWFVK